MSQFPSLPPLVVLSHTDSTNNHAINLVRTGMAKHGAGILAHVQTDGKGQRGKKWDGEPGKGLYLSLILRTAFLPPSKGFELLASVTVAVCKTISQLTDQQFKIKWPNDLYWNDRKAGGLLIESTIKGGQWEWAVVGIGINVLQDTFPKELPNPVSLKQITQKEIGLLELAQEIRRTILLVTEQLEKEGFESIYQDYLELLYKKGEDILLQYQGGVFNTVLRSVSKDGRLETGQEQLKTFQHGEVEWKHLF